MSLNVMTFKVFWFLLLSGFSVSAVNVINNGDFKQKDKNDVPVGWNLSASPDMSMRVVADGYNSDRALLVDSKVLFGGGRAALRQFLPLVPNRKYELSCYCVGEAGPYLSIAMGNRWGQRMWVRRGENWQRFIETVECKPKGFSWKNNYELCLLVESKCNARVSNICLRPLNAFNSVKSEYSRDDSLYVVKRLKSFSLDVEDIPKELTSIPIEIVNMPENGLDEKSISKRGADLSAEVAFAADRMGLYFFAKVLDDKHFTRLGADMWNGDSVQLGIEQSGNLTAKKSVNDREIGFCFAGNKADNFDWTIGRVLTSDEMEYTVKSIAGGYLIVACLKWKFLDKIDLAGTGRFSVNVVVNDTDDGIQRKSLSLAPGLYSNKSNKENIVCLLKKEKELVTFLPDSTVITDKFEAQLILTGKAKSSEYKLQVISASGNKFKLDLPKDKIAGNDLPVIADIRVEGDRFESGKSTVQVISAGEVKAEITVEKKDYVNDFQLSLPLVRKRYEALKNKISELQKQGIATKRMQVAVKITERQFGEFLDNLKVTGVEQKQIDYNSRIGTRICRELNMMFDLVEHDKGQALYDVPVYKSSARILKDSYFEATVRDSLGKETTRPVIFSGYGHFGQVQKDIEWFPEIGANFIQTEIGPRIVTGENEDGTFSFDYKEIEKKCRILERAWNSNVVVNLLISPHYYPEWALKKHPESAWNSGGFLRYDVQDEYAKKLVGAYLKELVATIKKSPGAGALHSICLSNEPKLTISLKSKLVRKRFIKHLEQKYGNISALNKAWDRKYKTFGSAVPHSDKSGSDNPGLYYDFAVFKMFEFADWHEWMADIVKKEWPGMPVHSKQLSSFGTALAADYEMFSRFSDVNGTDASDTFTEGLMASMQKVHIVNSENHIIPDCHQPLVPYEEIFQKMFRQFVYGVGASAVWVWEPYSLQMFEQKHALDGNIYRRPLNILAVYDAANTANRLIEEIKSGFNADAEVAILYSRASAIHNNEYENSCRTIWYNLQHTGHKARFISEDQLDQNSYGKCKLIFAPDNYNIKATTINSLNRFIEQGGKVITIGNSFKEDQYGRKLRKKVRVTKKLSGKLLKDDKELLNTMKTITDLVLTPLPIAVSIAKGDIQSVNWRCTAMPKGESLVYIENLGEEDFEIKLSQETHNLITGEKQQAVFILKPWELKLLKVK